ncbi:MAG TPA: peptide chain release factor N(5)-glutamine methyltransferase [Candidatus Saccharimonadales bacterium]|nr:peptide chain release factor N(5)-glutamine methyltransferase [Candidatus Saccharimonadales bacterium]
MTVLEAIQRSNEFLARKGVESPRLQVELLLSHLLQMPRLKLYLNFEKTLTQTEVDRLRTMVQRRGEREPLQHIVGSTSFCGYEFVVSKDVLIPRPETEQLAEKAWQLLEKRPGAVVLDFGTGSGCLAVTLALKCPSAEIHAVDISEAALAIARRNAEAHKVAERVQFHTSDRFSNLPVGLSFDVIVGNPPYIPSGDIAGLQPEVRDFDPKGALDGGRDGLDYYRQLATEAPERLRPGNTVLLEFGDGQENQLSSIFSAMRWKEPSIEKDLSGRARILIAHCVNS